MLPVEEITCPYCWETMEVLLDEVQPGVAWTEDCQVCCRPILLTVLDVGVRADRENS